MHHTPEQQKPTYDKLVAFLVCATVMILTIAVYVLIKAVNIFGSIFN